MRLLLSLCSALPCVTELEIPQYQGAGMEQLKEAPTGPSRRLHRPPWWALGLAAAMSLSVGLLVPTLIGPGLPISAPGGTEEQLLRAGLPQGYVTAPATASQYPFITRVDAHVLIPGAGDPIPNASVIFSDANQILFAGPRAQAPGGLRCNRTYAVEAVMPGLWDCHTHFAGPLKFKDEPFKLDGVLSSGAYPMNYVRFYAAVTDLRAALMAGVTSVREVGGPFGQALHELLRTGRIAGPNFHFAGRAIGMTSGHADEQTLPLDVFLEMDRQRLTVGALCDGVPECLKRERENLRMQADVIKIMASGGVLSEFDQPTDAELSVEEIRAITADARRARRAVAAHAHSAGGIRNAIVGGVTSIEHGTWMSEALADLLLQRDYMVYTPTITVVQDFFNGTTRPPFLDENQWRKGQRALRQHSKAVRMAIAKGVPIVAGTDCPGSCAKVGREVNFLHMFGMTPLQAIRAATADAPRCMGQWGLAPKSGRLEPGFEADVIGLAVSPLVDLQVLTRSGDVTHVWKAGKLVKTAGRSPWDLGRAEQDGSSDRGAQ